MNHQKIYIMKSNQSSKKSYVLEIIGGVLSTICIFMLISYFFEFHDGFSNDYNKWGAFGSYFGSITGLLAFLGVLYSLILSNRATEEAKKESQIKEGIAKKETIRREERDLFFKLLELDRDLFNNVKFVECFKEVGHKKENIYGGIEAFEKFRIQLNNTLIEYIIYDYMFKMSTDKLKDILKSENQYYDSILNIKSDTLTKLKSFERFNNGSDSYLIEKKKLFAELLKQDISSIFSNNEIKPNYSDEQLYKFDSEFNPIQNLSSNERYIALKYVGDILNEVYGHILEQYIRNTYYILNTCNDFSEEKKGYYFKLYRAQLSRSEAIVVFIGALSSKSKTNFVKLLKSSEFLDVIHYKDLYLLNNEAGEGNEKSFINSMFDEFLKENPE